MIGCFSLGGIKIAFPTKYFAVRLHQNVMTLENCYHAAAKLLGPDPESLFTVQSVDFHRQYWRPKKVHTVLLAESHVYTSPGETLKMVGAAWSVENEIIQPFVRLVYCLGYGEPEYVGFETTKNPGTPQYWKLLSSCVGLAPTKVLKSQNKNLLNRLSAKTEVLSQMRDMGIWLVDASILALYRPGGERPTSLICQQVLECCWDNYIRSQIVEANPSSILIIGKGVCELLKSKLLDLKQELPIHIDWVRQPQGCRSTQAVEEMHLKAFNHCNDARMNRR